MVCCLDKEPLYVGFQPLTIIAIQKRLLACRPHKVVLLKQDCNGEIVAELYITQLFV